MPRWLDRLQALRWPPQVSVHDYLRAHAAGDLEIEERFLCLVRLASGVFKVTHRNRFDDTFALITEALSAATPLRVLDVACSSGVSTVELHRALVLAGHTVETIGTDLTTRLQSVELEDGVVVVVDPDDVVLGVEIDGMYIDRVPSRQVQLHHPIRVVRALRLLRRLGRKLETKREPRVEIPLVSSIVGRTPGVRVVEEDLSRPVVGGGFDLVRAANILNHSYFSGARLTELARALVARIAPGGLLFVVRTAGRENRGTLWRRTASDLVEVGRIGPGSEIADIIVSAAQPHRATGSHTPSPPPRS